MNILYFGFKNPVHISGIDSGSLEIKVEHADHMFIDGQLLLIPNDQSSRLVNLTVGKKELGEIQWMDSTVFRVRLIPSPKLYHYIKSNTFVRSTDLLVPDFLSVLVTFGTTLSLNYNVNKFRVTIIGESFFHREHIDNRCFTPSVKHHFTRLKEGDYIIYDQAEVLVFTDWDTVITNPDPMVLMVSNRTGVFQYETGNDFHKASSLIEHKPYNQLQIEEDTAEIYIYTNGEKRILARHILKKSSVIFNEDGNKLIEITATENPEQLNFKSFYPSGKIAKAGKLYKSKSGQIIEDIKLNNEIQILKMRREEIPEEVSELLFFQIQPPYLPIGKWKSFHENGKIKSEGEFNFKVTDFGCYYYPFRSCIDERDHMEALKHGTWKHYSKRGKLERTENYILGVK